MKIVITGNMGYVGSVLARHLSVSIPEARVVGFDTAYFAHCLTAASTLPEHYVHEQHFGDVRSLPDSLLAGADAVIHLAAVSNDPMGSKYEAVTDEINFRSSVDIARRAVAFGVSRFIFASSCSIYGFADGPARRETDAVNPLTAYARSKVATENVLAAMDVGDTTVTALRFSTACGMSPRLRLDLVLNDFVACAVLSRRISVLSDGSPWRPLIDVKDMARAVEWALIRNPADSASYLAVNVGAEEWNYQVSTLAKAVADHIPGTAVEINAHAPPDKRSYRVDFSLYRRLAPRHQPCVTLPTAIAELTRGIEALGLRTNDFRSSDLIRLKVLDRHVADHRLDQELRWLPADS